MFKFLSAMVSGLFTMKAFMGGLFMTVLGVVLYNLLVDTVEEIFNYALTEINGVNAGTISSPTITGFAGWFLAQVKIPEIFSVIVTCVILRWTLTKIPFLKW